MHRWSHATFLYISGAVLLIAIASGWWWVNRSPVPSGEISELRTEMRTHIRSNPSEAYAWFIRTYESRDFDAQHNAAHLFGETLFDVLGGKGMRICDAQFNYGCYHGFLSRAISQEGLTIVKKLDAVCLDMDRATVCQHGIGHGILEYLGTTKIDAALAACDQTYQPDPLAGCTSGVFMEYNIPLLESPDATLSLEARPLKDSNNLYDVCTTVAQKYRESCYHELPQWWQFVYSHDFKSLGLLCQNVSEPSSREACFRGIAKVVASDAKYDPEQTIARCRMLPTQEVVDQCITISAWAFDSNVGDRAGARTVCAAASQPMRVGCPK